MLRLTVIFLQVSKSKFQKSELNACWLCYIIISNCVSLSCLSLYLAMRIINRSSSKSISEKVLFLQPVVDPPLLPSSCWSLEPAGAPHFVCVFPHPPCLWTVLLDVFHLMCAGVWGTPSNTITHDSHTPLSCLSSNLFFSSSAFPDIDPLSTYHIRYGLVFCF